MPGRRSAKEQIGESRWKVLCYPRAYLKIVLLVLPIAAISLSLTFDKSAYVHVKNDTHWFNLTVKFPFHSGKDIASYTGESSPPKIEFDKDVEICSWLFVGQNAAWFIMALGILLTYICVHGGDRMENAASMDGLISCTMALIGATLTSLWLYNVTHLRKTIIGSVNYVYNGPSQCNRSYICEKSIPDFLQLYIAAGIGFFASVIWGISIFAALRYSFAAKTRGNVNITGILEMNDGRPDYPHL